MQRHREHYRRRWSQVFLLMACALVATSTARARVWHVDVDAAPGGDGLSWATAFADLHDGLAACLPGDEIWVAEGVYTPGGVDADPSLAYVPPAQCAVYGGFRGTESERSQRDWRSNRTVLSGDLLGNDDPDDPASRADNSSNVMRFADSPTALLIDGFVIRGGDADDSVSLIGGAINIRREARLRCRNIAFMDNHAWGQGGAVCIGDGSAIIEDCEFVGNVGGFGGGVSISRGNLTLRRVIARGNAATHEGAVVHSLRTEFVTISDCRFDDNIAQEGAGCIRMASGGALTVDRLRASANQSTRGAAVADLTSGSHRFNDCVFDGNSSLSESSVVRISDDGELVLERCRFRESSLGGQKTASNSTVEAWGVLYLEVQDCHFHANRSQDGPGAIQTWQTYTLISNTTFSQNRSGQDGGAILTREGTTLIADCTFSSNTANRDGGAIYGSEDTVTIDRCAFVDNFARAGGGAVFGWWTVFPRIANSAFLDNRSSRYGPVVCLTYDSHATIVNCAMLRNLSPLGGTLTCEAGARERRSNLLVINSVVRNGGNEARAEGRSIIQFEHCNVEHGAPGKGNIDVNPGFVRGTLTPAPGSPLIDAGSTAHLPLDMPKVDLAGQPRCHDDLWMRNTSSTDFDAIDIGPVEFQELSGDLAQIAVEPDPLRANAAASMRLRDGVPLGKAWLLTSKSGPGETDIRGLGIWADLDAPSIAGQPRLADASGQAEWRMRVPGGLSNSRMWIQVVQQNAKSERRVLDVVE